MFQAMLPLLIAEGGIWQLDDELSTDQALQKDLSLLEMWLMKVKDSQ